MNVEYKINSRSIMREGKLISDEEALELAKANGYDKAQFLIIRFTGNVLSVDDTTKRIKGFKRI